MERLKGKTAMVVGAGSIGPGWGNGKATAVTVAREGAQVFDKDNQPAERSVTLSGVSGAMIDKGNFRHFMQKEIFEQPVVVAQTLKSYLRRIDDQVSLTYFHLHDFEDGCKWRATETLTGTLDDNTCVLALSYKYRESVEVSNGACATPCSGDGSFQLQIVPIIE